MKNMLGVSAVLIALASAMPAAPKGKVIVNNPSNGGDNDKKDLSVSVNSALARKVAAQQAEDEAKVDAVIQVNQDVAVQTQTAATTQTIEQVQTVPQSEILEAAINQLKVQIAAQTAANEVAAAANTDAALVQVTVVLANPVQTIAQQVLTQIFAPAPVQGPSPVTVPVDSSEPVATPIPSEPVVVVQPTVVVPVTQQEALVMLEKLLVQTKVYEAAKAAPPTDENIAVIESFEANKSPISIAVDSEKSIFIARTKQQAEEESFTPKSVEYSGEVQTTRFEDTTAEEAQSVPTAETPLTDNSTAQVTFLAVAGVGSLAAVGALIFKRKNAAKSMSAWTGGEMIANSGAVFVENSLYEPNQ